MPRLGSLGSGGARGFGFGYVPAGGGGGTPGKLYSWGDNRQGQLMVNNRNYYSSPKQVGTLSTWINPMVTDSSTLCTQSPGSIWVAGTNNAGILGLGSSSSSQKYSSPVQVGALTTWSSTDASNYSMYAVKTNGTLWVWGSNSNGQLGTGNTTYYSSPVQVGALTTWKQAGSYSAQALVTRTDGTLWGMGDNYFGALGNGVNGGKYSSPIQVGTLTNWNQVAMGNYTGLAVKTDGTLWTWGRNYSGILATGNRTYYSSPKQVGALTNWAEVRANANSAWAIKTDGTLWAWGLGSFGVLGLGNQTSYSSPKQVGALTNWSKLSRKGGSNFMLAIKTNGTLWSWGRNSAGQLGIGSTLTQLSPVQVGALTTWLQVAAGNYTTMATQSA